MVTFFFFKPLCLSFFSLSIHSQYCHNNQAEVVTGDAFETHVTQGHSLTFEMRKTKHKPSHKTHYYNHGIPHAWMLQVMMQSFYYVIYRIEVQGRCHLEEEIKIKNINLLKINALQQIIIILYYSAQMCSWQLNRHA